MVSPKLLLLYSSTWKNILKAGGPLGRDLIQFFKTLSALREALTCSVCGNLLTGDELYSPSASSSCNHFACKNCMGGERSDNGYCESCSDWEDYREDETLSFLMQGYRQFCRYFLRSKECTRILEIKCEVDPEFDALHLLDIITEGSRQYRKPHFNMEEIVSTDSTGVVPICFDHKLHVDSDREITEVVLDPEEERKFEIDIKMEPVESMQFHEVIVEQEPMEPEVRTNDVVSLGSRYPSIISMPQDPLGNYDEVQEDDEEDEEQEEEIRSSSLRLASPPPIPQPLPIQQTQPTTIMFQRTPQPVGTTQQIQLSSKQVQSFVLAGSPNSPARQIQFTGARIPGTSTFRFARLSLDGRPLTMVRHVLGQASTAGVRHTVTLPINTSALTKNKIIVRPGTGTSVTTAHMQKWPDANKVLQYASGGTVLPPGTSFSTPRASYSNITSSATSSINFRPHSQQVTKISLGNMGAVVSSSSLSNVINRPATLATPSGEIIGTIGTVVRTDSMSSDGTIKKLKVRLPKSKIQSKLRKGCRCGNAASQPGKLTCCGQRCPCYVDAKSCTDCRCRGCRNPHLPGGKKLLQGINAVIDTKTNTTVPMSINMTAGASTSSAMTASSSSAKVVTSIPMSTSTMNLVPVSGSQIYSRIHYPGTTHATTTSYSQLIPLANFGGFSIPISLISPASHATTNMQTMQAHTQPIRMQCIQSINNTLAPNISSISTIKTEAYNQRSQE